MRRQLCFIGSAVSLLLATASIAHAADLDGMPPIWNGVEQREGSAFAGFYGGATLGLGFNTNSTPATGTTGGFAWGNTPIYSAFAGYNFVHGRFVWGLEGELARGSLGATALSGVANVSTYLDYQATARVRAGLLLTPSLLLYGKLGTSYAGMTFTDTTTTNTASSNFYGLTTGLGAEWKMTDHVGLRLDYDYNSFNSGSVNFPNNPTTFKPAYNTLRLGFSVKF